jgi:hypothetical protein
MTRMYIIASSSTTITLPIQECHFTTITLPIQECCSFNDPIGPLLRLKRRPFFPEATRVYSAPSAPRPAPRVTPVEYDRAMRARWQR